MKRYLPIGSVVLLKESTKRVMIVGLRQKEEGTEKIWDYSACLFPEGVLDPDQLYLFDNDQIEQLFFVGFQDAECLQFMSGLSHMDEE